MELSKTELINFITRYRQELTVEELKRRNLAQLVMIKTKIEIEQINAK